MGATRSRGLAGKGVPRAAAGSVGARRGGARARLWQRGARGPPLAPGHRYTGVDISSEQLRRASALVPAGQFIKADYTELEFPRASVDAVVALYTFGHVPRVEVAGIYTRIASWLKPGGFLLATTGREDSADTVDEDWLGAPMFFSGFDVETNLRLLAEAGLDVLEHEVVCQDEAEQGEACFLWVLARRS